ncbi:MAG: alpha/beta fold hydrolase [Myxococcales bacterium]|nr:alpha/beta fold hydrolase [Myxococcales bacterium]MCB9627472.1 alpha/beta fold hydrolase [Sandaracinaceae bacterium]
MTTTPTPSASHPDKSTNGRSLNPRTSPGFRDALLHRAVALGGRVAPFETGGLLVDVFTRAPRPYPRSADVDSRLMFAEPWSVAVAGRTLRGFTLRPEGRHPNEDGDGPAVLLVHGWAGGGHQLLPIARPLVARGYSVSFFDLPAHGMSDGHHATLRDIADAIAGVAASLGRLHAVVAHSVGGAGTILSLLDGRLDAGRVALVAPPTSLEEQARAFAEMLHAPDAAVRAMLATLHGLVGRPIDRASWLRDVAHLQVPLLVVHDRKDRITPFDGSSELVRHWPGARLMATEGLGHARILTEPQVIDAIVRFLGAPAAVSAMRAA